MRCLLVSSLLFESFDQTYHRIMRPFALLSARGETEGRSFSKCLTPLGMMAQGITGGISGNPRMWHLWTYIFHQQLFSCTCWPFPKRFDLSGLALTIFGLMVSVQISCGTYGVIEAGRGAKSTVCTLGWKLHSMLWAVEIETIKKKKWCLQPAVFDSMGFSRMLWGWTLEKISGPAKLLAFTYPLKSSSTRKKSAMVNMSA